MENVFWHNPIKTNEDQIGHPKFMSYPDIHYIPHLCLTLWNEAEQNFN